MTWMRVATQRTAPHTRYPLAMIQLPQRYIACHGEEETRARHTDQDWSLRDAMSFAIIERYHGYRAQERDRAK